MNLRPARTKLVRPFSKSKIKQKDKDKAQVGEPGFNPYQGGPGRRRGRFPFCLGPTLGYTGALACVSYCYVLLQWELSFLGTGLSIWVTKSVSKQ
jgi:hypothetical protein